MADVIIGRVYEYDNGQAAVEFHWHGAARSGWAWSVPRQQCLESYRTRRDVQAAYDRSNNSDGAYGCAILRLSDDE